MNCYNNKKWDRKQSVSASDAGITVWRHLLCYIYFGKCKSIRDHIYSLTVPCLHCCSNEMWGSITVTCHFLRIVLEAEISATGLRFSNSSIQQLPVNVPWFCKVVHTILMSFASFDTEYSPSLSSKLQNNHAMVDKDFDGMNILKLFIRLSSFLVPIIILINPTSITSVGEKIFWFCNRYFEADEL